MTGPIGAGENLNEVNFNWTCNACQATVAAKDDICQKCGCPAGLSGKEISNYQKNEKYSYISNYYGKSWISETASEVKIAFPSLARVFGALALLAITAMLVNLSVRTLLDHEYLGVFLFSSFSIVTAWIMIGIIFYPKEIIWKKNTDILVIKSGIGFLTRSLQYQKSSYFIGYSIRSGSRGMHPHHYFTLNPKTLDLNTVEIGGYTISSCGSAAVRFFIVDIRCALCMQGKGARGV